MLWSRRGSATWEMRSWQAASSFSFSSIFLLLSDWVFSSCLQRFTIVFTSLFNLLMYRRATVNSSSIRPLPPSCCFEEKSSHTMAFVAVWFCAGSLTGQCVATDVTTVLHIPWCRCCQLRFQSQLNLWAEMTSSRSFSSSGGWTFPSVSAAQSPETTGQTERNNNKCNISKI